MGPMLIASLPTLRRFALSLARQSDIADDLVQAACERALLNASSFEHGTRFEAWMFRIVRNLWIDRIRRSKTQSAVPVEDGQNVVGEDGEALAIARLELSDTAAAILELPEEQREVVMLVCVEDLSYAEAASVIGAPIGTVMSRLARARTRLAALLRDSGINATPRRSASKGKRKA
ncbi:RNA polymerase sigma factor [Acuticoccus kalidii]|uniref:RNA polymerase sigma factor n=1 Tax=Acuticoccus kalidii TaxID=2910977 RepID=UPI0021053997|nr:RNA polymerase sigma factor [Acuticoccus kalidii]